MLARLWRKGDPRALLVGLEVGVAILENGMDVSQDIKNKATI